jgi:hypothetical protein
MAELREIAFRIAAALLEMEEPEPLGVDLWNQSPDTAGPSGRGGDRRVPRRRRGLGESEGRSYVSVAMGGVPAGRRGPYGGTGVETDVALFQRAEFHRRA